jgi:hypothetical protein
MQETQPQPHTIDRFNARHPLIGRCLEDWSLDIRTIIHEDEVTSHVQDAALFTHTELFEHPPEHGGYGISRYKHLLTVNHVDQDNPEDLSRVRLVRVGQGELGADLEDTPERLAHVAETLRAGNEVYMALVFDQPNVDCHGVLRGEGELYSDYLNGPYRQAVLARRPRIDPSLDPQYAYL